ncbi:MAG: guanine deaminase [archaeon]|nr:guanine deaminase [archaeon]
MSNSILLYGTFLHTIKGELQILEKTYLTVINGKIDYIGKDKPEGEFKEYYETKPNQMIIPGMIDTHLHAPQYVFAGCGLDLPLLQWLEKYTFPAESKFSDIEHARKVYEAIVKRTLDHGTTTASYFATIWMESSYLLAEICKKVGQRAFIGKVSMDRNSPDFYIEKKEDAFTKAKEFVDKLYEKDSLVQPIITPRFVPSCTPELMKNLGDLGKERKEVLIQSHLDENLGEIAWVKELHPEAKSYTHVYDEFGLLKEGTILAHCVHITDEELLLMKERKASIAHCPSSNFLLYSGIADVRHIMDIGVKVGLGTDVAGGSSPSIIDAMRNALTCSRANLFQKRKEGKENEYKPLTTVDAFSLATERGAEALNIGEKVGNFLKGKEFDAVMVDMTKGQCDCFCEENPNDLLDKFVQRADDRNIIKVFVRGKLVKNLE